MSEGKGEERKVTDESRGLCAGGHHLRSREVRSAASRSGPASLRAPLGPRPRFSLSGTALVPLAPTPLTSTTLQPNNPDVTCRLAGRPAATQAPGNRLCSTRRESPASKAHHCRRTHGGRAVTWKAAVRGSRAASTGQTPSPRS